MLLLLLTSKFNFTFKLGNLGLEHFWFSFWELSFFCGATLPYCRDPRVFGLTFGLLDIDITVQSA